MSKKFSPFVLISTIALVAVIVLSFIMKDIKLFTTLSLCLSLVSFVFAIIGVTDKKFGNGQVVKQEGKYIEVKFKDVVKKFVLPGCIADKYLEVEDEEVYEYYVKCNENHKKRMETELKIKSATYAIQRHEDAIDRLNAKLK